MLLTKVVTGSWVSPDLERAMCAISYIVFNISSSPGLKIIDILTNQLGRRAGSGLKLCTTEVRAVRVFNHPILGHRLVLVDTPGFDGTDKSDLEILLMISNWLRKT